MSEKYQFKLPDIGEGMAEGTVGEWHVQEGDAIKKDDDLVQIENDKSVEELPSPVDGTIDKILVPADETAEVGQPLVEMTVADGLGNVDATTTPAKEATTPKQNDTTASGQDVYEFKLPDIGEGMAEGTVGEWHVKVGDAIKKDDDLVQIENDKSVEELPSPVDGTVLEILVRGWETSVDLILRVLQRRKHLLLQRMILLKLPHQLRQTTPCQFWQCLQFVSLPVIMTFN